MVHWKKTTDRKIKENRRKTLNISSFFLYINILTEEDSNMYILKEDIKDMDGLVRWLENHMIFRSEYSCKKRNARAVAIHFGGIQGVNTYIFCSDKMCNSNPHTSWLNCRKRYWTEEEFKSSIQAKLDERHDAHLRETLGEDMAEFLKNIRK